MTAVRELKPKFVMAHLEEIWKSIEGAVTSGNTMLLLDDNL